jgi:hypothetical protein
MDLKIIAIDAEFTLVNESDKERTQIRNLPANLADVNLFRHPKSDPNPDYLQTIKDDMALDIELGLNNQFEIDQKRVLQKDIDELTKSNEYYQITPKLLNRLFKLGHLRSLCTFFNIKEAVTQSINGAKIPIIFGILLIVSVLGIVTMAHFYDSFKSAQIYITFSAVLMGVAAVIFFVCVIASFIDESFGHIEFNFKFMRAGLTIENVKETRVIIPKMAKLKMKEAKDSELFEGFSIAYPKFYVDEKHYKPRFKFDPVILGVTKDSRVFMICWWDIAKDIDRVKTHIKMFKKFKIS